MLLGCILNGFTLHYIAKGFIESFPHQSRAIKVASHYNQISKAFNHLDLKYEGHFVEPKFPFMILKPLNPKPILVLIACNFFLLYVLESWFMIVMKIHWTRDYKVLSSLAELRMLGQHMYS